MATESLESRIRKQTEFYFSDSNYRRDSFLRAAAENDPEGFVPIATLLTFNKLKQLTTDANAVAAAVEASDEVVLSDDRLSIRRKVPLPEEDLSKQRSVYVKGFDPEDPDATIDGIQEFFSRYGRVLYVRLRRDHETKQFKGSCFVEYEDREKAEACVNDASNITWKDKPFDCVMHLADWLKNRHEKKKAAHKRKAGATREAETKGEDNFQFESGLIVKFEGVPESTRREDLQERFGPYGEIKYIEFSTGLTEGYLRFADAASARAAAEAIQKGDLKVKEEDPAPVTGALVEGDAEKEYWDKVKQKSKDKRDRLSKQKRRRRN